MLKENYYKPPKMSLGDLAKYIIEDNRARLRLLEKKPNLYNKILSFLSPNNIAVVLYRLSHYFHCHNINVIAKLFYFLNIIIFGCDISIYSEIGPGLFIAHITGTAIHAKIGKNACIYGRVALGGRGTRISNKGWLGGPVIGDNVTFGFGASVFGHVKIGNDVFIGAMSMVTRSLPDGAVAMGIPAKIKYIKRKGSVSNNPESER